MFYRFTFKKASTLQNVSTDTHHLHHHSPPSKSLTLGFQFCRNCLPLFPQQPQQLHKSTTQPIMSPIKLRCNTTRCRKLSPSFFERLAYLLHVSATLACLSELRVQLAKKLHAHEHRVSLDSKQKSASNLRTPPQLSNDGRHLLIPSDTKEEAEVPARPGLTANATAHHLVVCFSSQRLHCQWLCHRG